MKFGPASFPSIASATGFEASHLEKLLGLRVLLAEFHNSPFLRNKLVLKGGTAINLLYLDVARLSVNRARRSRRNAR